MAVIISPPPFPPEGGPPDAPATYTPTFYQQSAAHFHEILDEVAARIPRDPDLVLKASFVKTHLNIPPKFLATAVAAVEQVPELKSVGKLDLNRGRDTLQLLDAFRPVRAKGKAFLDDLGNILDSRQVLLAVEALEVYHVAQSLARDESNPTLMAWVDIMASAFGRRGRSKKPDPPPDVDPVPVTIWVPEKPEGRNG